MIEVRGGFVYEVYPFGEVLVDNLYHVRLEVDDLTVKARVFDYFGEKQLTRRTVSFKVGDADPQGVETSNGVATLLLIEKGVEVKATIADGRGASVQVR